MKCIYQSIITALLFVALLNVAEAQRDRQFWFVAPEATDQHGELPIFLRLASTGTPATVTISQPANPNFSVITQSVPANSITSVNLSSFLSIIENFPANTILTNGLLIESDQDITAYYEIANTFNPEIFPLKGQNALGTEFFVPAQNLYRNEVGSAAFDIVATENNTVVTITPAVDIVGHPANIPFTITLNRGQTFSCRSLNTSAASSLGGSKITSDKPIAVTINDDSIRSGNAWDMIGDQLVPTPLIGTEYIAVKGLNNNERVFFVATQDQTNIYVNGGANPVATLNEGQMSSTGITGTAAYIQADKPIYAYHISGHEDEMGDAVLPPIACTGSDRISFVRPGNDRFSMMVLTQAGNENNFTLNGAATTWSFQPVPGNSNWVAALVNASVAAVPSGVNTITNSSGLFHLGILYNYDNFSSEYGYFSNYSSMNIGENQVVCQGTSVTLSAGNDKTSYLWSTGDTVASITVAVQDTYWIEAELYNCTLRDTMVLNVNEVSVDIGEDISMCAYSDTVFTATSPNQQLQYSWQDGSTASNYFAFDTGTVMVTVTDTIGCTASDTALFAYYPIVDIGADTSFVCDSITFLIASNLLNANHIWQDGSTDSVYLVTSNGWFWVEATDEHGCISTDTLFVAFVNSPVLDLGADTTVCPDQPVTFDATITKGVSYLWQDSISGAVFTTTDPEEYIVQVVDTTTCYTWDTVNVFNFYVPDSLLEDTVILCDEETYLLDPLIDNAVSYDWQDGSSGGTFTIETQGLYSLYVEDENGCATADSTYAFYLDSPVNWTLPPDTTVCWREPLLLNAAQPFADGYLWSGYSSYYGENDPSDSTFLIRLDGIYTITIFNECGEVNHTIEVIQEDCSCDPFIPNAFTPNNDGNNDIFKIYMNMECEILDVELSIFDRKGTLLYVTNSIDEGWDGTFNGVIMRPSVYIWQLRYTSINASGVLEPKLKAGDITIVR